MSHFREDELLCEMVLVLGRLPEPLWSRWTHRHQYFDDQCNYIGTKRRPLSQSWKFSKFGDCVTDGEKERKLFETMLREMVDYDSQRRMKAVEIVNSD